MNKNNTTTQHMTWNPSFGAVSYGLRVSSDVCVRLMIS